MPGLSWTDAARLLRRTGFGTTGNAVDQVAGTDATTVVRRLVATDFAKDKGVVATPIPELDIPPHLEVDAAQDDKQKLREALQAGQFDARNWWYARMLSAEQPFGERLTFAWHSIFATSVVKVRFGAYMLHQNETLRVHGLGDFHDLAYRMLTDAAMLVWLDGDSSSKGAANENLSREFMELFTLGVNGGYTEDDVREGARALTGWRVDRTDGSTALDAKEHDAGSKTFLGKTGNFDAADYCDIVLARPASAPFVIGRLWQQLVSDAPIDAATSAAAVAAYGSKRDIGAALTAMLTAPGFTAARGSKVLSPVEWAVGLGRSLGIDHRQPDSVKIIAGGLTGLGQEPFKPPSVGGWPAGQGWLSTSAADARIRLAAQLTAAGDVDQVASASASNRLDAAAHLLGIPSWSDRSAQALKDSISDPQQLVAFAANTPEYLTS